MTNDEVIKLAREAGLEDWSVHGRIESKWDCLAKFAALVAAAEREECAKLAAKPQCWPMPAFNSSPSDLTIGRIEGEKNMSYRISAAIRARGKA